MGRAGMAAAGSIRRSANSLFGDFVSGAPPETAGLVQRPRLRSI